jgi:hypothetical protein
VYVRQVAGAVLSVASLTRAFAEYDPDSTARLALAWAAPAGDGPVHLRVRGIRRDLYYAMDAVRPAGSRGYEWPTSILAAQRIRRPDIGVLGWTRATIGGVDRPVYLPLRVAPARPGAAAPAAAGYEVVLYPNVRLDEVFVTLTALDAGGRVRATVKRGEALGLGFYPAERPVRVRLADPGAPGLYLLEISARAAGGAAATVEPVLFYHDPR